MLIMLFFPNTSFSVIRSPVLHIIPPFVYLISSIFPSHLGRGRGRGHVLWRLQYQIDMKHRTTCLLLFLWGMGLCYAQNTGCCFWLALLLHVIFIDLFLYYTFYIKVRHFMQHCSYWNLWIYIVLGIIYFGIKYVGKNSCCYLGYSWIVKILKRLRWYQQRWLLFSPSFDKEYTEYVYCTYFQFVCFGTS